ncbi:MAG: aldehyde dehydrogenase family protein [Desulfobacterales bacterium]
MAFKITYSVIQENMAQIDDAFDLAVEGARGQLGETYPALLGYAKIAGAGLIENRNPADTRVVLSRHHRTPVERIDEMMALANRRQKEWRHTPYPERCRLLRRVADQFRDRQYDLAAVMTLEVGKNRLESLGEVQECVDMIHYYVDQFEQNDGFARQMASLAPEEKTLSILKPYGVFIVIEPFNFPLALAVGALTAALVSGNTAIFKLSSTTPWSAENLLTCFRDGGIPEGVVQIAQGGGADVGEALVTHPLTSGIAFTGSYETGTALMRSFGVGGAWVRPCITEMGGKNPGIVGASANIEKAVTAAWKSGFGLSGQKCSEMSRLLVHESIADDFCARLIKSVNSLVVGDPVQKETFIGPVIDARAVERFFEAVRQVKSGGGRILAGGGDIRERRPELAHGYFVEPTIVEVPRDHPLTRQELFLPLLNLYTFSTIEQALDMANDVPYGLTAGIFSTDEQEIGYFLEHIEAGCTYVNRPTGITTGAWPGVNPFCGWKGSGGSGKGFLGPYYVAQFMREQSQTRHPV